MKKILFCLQTMVLGGVEKQLISIMKQMSPEEYEITLLLLYISDVEILKEIPSYVRVINLEISKEYYCASLVSMFFQRIKKGKIIEALILALKRGLNLSMTHTSTNISAIPSIEDSYDVAVCYHMHAPLMVRYVAEKTTANKKIVWIHNDFSTTHYRVQKLAKYFKFYHEIVAVSNSVKDEFIQQCPAFSGKVYMHHNIIDRKDIIAKSQEPTDKDVHWENYSTKLLTIGRLTNQKGFDFAIKAAALLRKDKYEFKWYFIGSGEMEEELQRQIVDNNVEDCVFIMGRKNNPYPYLKECDIYVQPSRHEAYCTTVNEAKTLNKPIICYQFAGSEEQIIDGQTGLLIPVGCIEKLAEAIRRLLDEPQTRQYFSTMLEKEGMENNDWHAIRMHFNGE